MRGGLYDNSVRVWDAVTGTVTSTLQGHSDTVTSVAFSPDGNDNSVCVCDSVTGTNF